MNASSTRFGQPSMLSRVCALLLLSLSGVMPRSSAQPQAPATSGDGRERVVVRIGGDSAYPPYEFVNEDGDPDGFNVDLVRAACRVANLEPRIQLGPWHETRQSLERGDIDVITGMYFSPERAQSVLFSAPHTMTFHAIFVRRGNRDISGHADLAGRAVAVQRGDIMHDYLVARGLSDALVLVEAPRDALQQVAVGACDCALLERHQAMYLIRSLGLSDVVPRGPLLRPGEYCLAVRKDAPELLQRLDEAIHSLKDDGSYSRLYSSWFGYDESRRRVVRVLTTAGAVVAILLLLFLGAIAWSWTLRRRVAAQTRELNQELAERAAIQAELERLATAVSQAAEAIMITDPGANIQYVNPAFEQMTGYTAAEALGRNARFLKSDKHGKDFYAAMWVQLKRGQTWQGRMQNRRRDGSLYEEDCTISPVRNEAGEIVSYVAIKRDVTQMTALQEQLRQAQKLEAVGVLAGGVAHDFNNLLMVILNNADFLRDSLTGREQDLADLDEIRDACMRGAALVKQLLAFSRKQPLSKDYVALSATVRRMATMLRRLIGEHVRLEVIVGSANCLVYADLSQVEQVLLNLAVNARDAMPSGGVLKLTTREVVVTKEEARLLARGVDAVDPGDYVELVVQDSGSGIPSDMVERIFEPFFTTKEPGKGTGLGLSTVYGIMRQHNGMVVVESEVGNGTAFRLLFPKAPSAAAEAGEAPAAQTGPGPNREGEE